MNDIAIHVENLGKQYRIGERQRYKALRDTLSYALYAPFRAAASFLNGHNGHRSIASNRSSNNDLWALKDISFEIKKGEVVGIIGRNGAGKSTLLKILSRITKPTKGYVRIQGRIGSLLEVGTGFHPELTGRENIYLNGAIIGMRKREIDRKFDEIVAFAEIEKFIDTPVKFYSSGMYVRLAFAVAAHLEPEILLVDEVLAVGDAAFQKKCLGKMSHVAKEGRTVLFVSHNLQLISTIARRTILFSDGQIACDGDTSAALHKYRQFFQPQTQGEYVNDFVTMGIRRARVITSTGTGVHHFGKPLELEFEINLLRKLNAGAFSFQIVDNSARPIAHLWLLESENPWTREGRVKLRCILPQPKLYMGRYAIVTHLCDRSTNEHFEALDWICPFEVVMDGIYREYDWVEGACTYLEEHKWEMVELKLESR
jgi:ABC-type polysaccharide/polyol phosphate transport system ATPase subunit